MIQEIAKEYLTLDQNPITRNEIQELLNSSNQKALEECLATRMAFGTAGLRAAMGGGYSRMNELTVIQATQGVCAYLKQVNPNCYEQGVVIGHDHRHNSIDFAKVTAGVFLSNGIMVHFYKKLVHTPLVPFGVKTLKAACGIMITASHNPKQDNGYKLYWSNACQIIPPHDKNIAEAIEQNLVPQVWDKSLVDSSPLCQNPIDEIEKAYYEALSKFNLDLKFCYTAMHGVGYPYAKRAFDTFGLSPFIPVVEQVQPDPDFPTVEFPNPEEGKGALALAIKTAETHGAQIILANDPDADRLAIAEKQKNGTWHIFTGNEIGTMFGALLWSRVSSPSSSSASENNKINNKYAMLASTVSTQILGQMAKKEGFYYQDTLTGFKWLGNVSQDLTQEGYQVLFAFEEAIGFMVGDIVQDKDGISALAVFAECAAQIYKTTSMNMYEYLCSLYEKYGYAVSNNSYVICHDPVTIEKSFTNMRQFTCSSNSEIPNQEFTYPSTLGGQKVVGVRDLTVGYDSETVDHKPKLPKSKEMITFKLANQAWITVRTSGTEPKIKYYSELFAENKDQGEKELKALVDAFVEELLKPNENGFQLRKI